MTTVLTIFPKLYQPAPKQRRLFSFSRPWPWAYFLNGPNAAASVAATLICRHRVLHTCIRYCGRLGWLAWRRQVQPRTGSCCSACIHESWSSKRRLKCSSRTSSPPCLAGLIRTLLGIVVKSEEITLKFKNSSRCNKFQRVRKSLISTFNHNCYRKTLSVLNIVTMFSAEILIGQRSPTHRVFIMLTV